MQTHCIMDGTLCIFLQCIQLFYCYYNFVNQNDGELYIYYEFSKVLFFFFNVCLLFLIEREFFINHNLKDFKDINRHVCQTNGHSDEFYLKRFFHCKMNFFLFNIIYS